METKVKERFLISIFLTLLLEIISILLVTSWMVKVVLITMINLLLAYNVYQILKLLHQSNEERIKIATRKAELGVSSAINSLPVGIISYDQKKRLQWANPYAILQLGESDYLNKGAGIQQLITIALSNKPLFFYQGHYYRLTIDENNQFLYFQEATKEKELLLRTQENRLVIGMLSLDNYDEATDKMDEKEISYLNSFLTTYISDWMNEYHVFYKRINSEKYYFTCQYKELAAMMENKLNLLDIIRKAASEQDTPITISMGISYGQESPEKIGVVAQNNLDMALVRGGDQAVLKDTDEKSKPIYFGGKTSSNTKRTRVRSRAIGTALGELITGSEDIFIMGHKYPDMDAIGAAVGVSALARFYQRQAWIIIDPDKIIPDVEKALKEMKNYPELQEIILTPEEAIEKKKYSSLLVMVDHNRPSLSISKTAYDAFDKVVVIDHHRRGEEFPENPLLVYLESSASSASELVAELIDFKSDNKHQLSKIESTLLYSGMVVDTKSFKVRTTSRTFDIASYLKAKGADLSLAEYLLSSDLHSYLEMSRLVSKAEYFTDNIVLVTGKEDHPYDPVTTAKAADTLLGLQDIAASFVITKRNDGLVGISARSSGTINVQMLMENLGGGGHFTNAAVQLKDTTVNEAKERLVAVIKQNQDEMNL